MIFFLKDKPAAREWMTKPISNYDKMVIIYGNDRATGEQSETAKELRRRQASEPQEEHRETIDDIDHLISTNEATLESCDPFENVTESWVLLKHILDQNLRKVRCQIAKMKLL